MLENTNKTLLELVNLLTETIDDLISECYFEGALKAPSKKSIIEARRLLPFRYKNTLIQKESD